MDPKQLILLTVLLCSSFVQAITEKFYLNFSGAKPWQLKNYTQEEYNFFREKIIIPYIRNENRKRFDSLEFDESLLKELVVRSNKRLIQTPLNSKGHVIYVGGGYQLSS